MHTAINRSDHHTELKEYGVNFISFNIHYYIRSWEEYMEETQHIPTRRNVDNKKKMEEPTPTKMEQARNSLYLVGDNYVKETQLPSCTLNLLLYNKFTSLKRLTMIQGRYIMKYSF